MGDTHIRLSPVRVVEVVHGFPVVDWRYHHCETRRVVIDDEKGVNAQISTDIVVFQALRNLQCFQ